DALAREPDLAAIDAQQPDEVLDRHALADARRADDVHDLAGRDREVDALEHRPPAERLLDAAELDQRARGPRRPSRHRSPPVTNSAAAEITKSRTITANELPITAAVVAQPTPSDEPRARSPQNPATTGMAPPYAVAL